MDNLNNLKTAVIKIGGSVLTRQVYLNRFARQVSTLTSRGVKCIIVHGGGPHITKLLKEKKLATTAVNGIRITDEATMKVVEEALIEVKKLIISSLLNECLSVEDNSGDIDFFKVKKMKNLVSEEGVVVDPGLVGEVTGINIKSIDLNSLKPVIISPVGKDKNGIKHNINADNAAMALAAKLHSDHLVFLSDVSGVLENPAVEDSILSNLSYKEAEFLVKTGKVKGGMIQKITNSLGALRRGVAKVYIADGREADGLINLLVHQRPIGTTIIA